MRAVAAREAGWAGFLQERLVIGNPPRRVEVEYDPFVGVGYKAANYARVYDVAVEVVRRLRAAYLVIVHHEDNKLTVYTYYGGQCCCDGCGATDIEAMTIDHIYGGGALFRITYGRSSHVLWAYVVKHNFPDDYDMKCEKCNFAKHRRKQCPLAGTPH